MKGRSTYCANVNNRLLGDLHDLSLLVVLHDVRGSLGDGNLGSVNGHLDGTGASGGLDGGIQEQGGLSVEQLQVLALGGADGAHQETPGLLLGAISGQEVEAVIQGELDGLLGHGLQGGSLHDAGAAGKGASGEDGADARLDGASDGRGEAGLLLLLLMVVGPVTTLGLGGGSAAGPSHDPAEGVGQGDVGPNDLLIGPAHGDGNGLVGGLQGETDVDDLGVAIELSGSVGLGHVLPPVGLEEGHDGLGVVEDILGHAHELDLKLDLVGGGSLGPHLLGKLGQLGVLSLGLALTELLGLGGSPAELLLLIADLGDGGELDLGLLAGGSKAEGALDGELGVGVADLLQLPDGDGGDGGSAAEANLLAALLGLGLDIPLLLDSLGAGGGAQAVGPGAGAGALQGQAVHQGEAGSGVQAQFLEHLLNLLGALGVDARGNLGHGLGLDGVGQAGGGLLLLINLDGVVLGGLTVDLGGGSELEEHLNVVNSLVAGVEPELKLVHADGRLVDLREGRAGPEEPDEVQGVVLVESQLVNETALGGEWRLSGNDGIEVETNVFPDIPGDLGGGSSRVDELHSLGDGEGSEVPELLGDAERPHVEVEDVNGLIGSQGLDVHLKLLLLGLELNVNFSGDVEDGVLIDTNEDGLVGEGADGSSPAGVLGGKDGLDLHVDGRNGGSGLNIGGTLEGNDDGHMGLNDKWHSHVGGDQVFGGTKVQHPLEVDGGLATNLALQKRGVLHVGSHLLTDELLGDSVKVVKEGIVFEKLHEEGGTEATSSTGLDVELFHGLAPLSAELLLQVLLNGLLAFGRMADDLREGPDNGVHARGSDIHSHGRVLVPVQEVDQLGINVLGKGGAGAADPRGQTDKANTELIEVIGGEHGAGGGESTLNLLDQRVDEGAPLLQVTDLGVHNGHVVLPAEGEEGSVDNLEDLHVGLVPGDRSNLLEDNGGRVQLEEDIEGGNTDFGGLAQVSKDGQSKGSNSLRVHLANNAKAGDSQEAAEGTLLLVLLGTGLNEGKDNRDDILVAKDSQGNEGDVHPLDVSSRAVLLELTLQIRDPLLDHDLAVLVAELSVDKGGVASLAVLSNAGLLDQGAEAHEGVAVDEVALVDPAGLDQLKDLGEQLLGGGDDVGRKEHEDGGGLGVGELSGLNEWLEDLHGTAGAAHDHAVKHDVLEGGQLLGAAVEIALELVIHLLNLVLGENGESAGNGQDLHGDLLLGNVLGLLQIHDHQLGHVLLDLGDELGGSVVGAVAPLGSGQGVLGKAPEGSGLLEVQAAEDALLEAVLNRLAVGHLPGGVDIPQVVEGLGLGGLGEGSASLLLAEELKDLLGAGEDLLSLEAQEVEVELALVDDGFDLQVLGSGGSAGDVAGDGAAGPLSVAVTGGAAEEPGLVVHEGGPLAAGVDVLGLGELVGGSLVALEGAVVVPGGGILGQVGGELVELVDDGAGAIDGLLVDHPGHGGHVVVATLALAKQKTKRCCQAKQGIRFLSLSCTHHGVGLELSLVLSNLGDEETDQGLLEVDGPGGLLLGDDNVLGLSAAVHLEESGLAEDGGALGGDGGDGGKGKHAPVGLGVHGTLGGRGGPEMFIASISNLRVCQMSSS